MNSGDNSNFDKDLQRLEAKYGNQTKEEPPAMLDQLILNKARQAVAPKAIRPWSFSWMPVYMG